MKINANTELLKKALAAAAAFCPTRTTMPILANVRLGATFGALTISGASTEAAATILLPCAVQEEGVTTVSADALTKIVAMLAAEFVTIETDQTGANLIISCPGYKGKLPTLDASNFPAIKQQMPDNAFSVPTAKFVAALNAVTRSASTDESRPTLTGVELTVDANCIQLAATDGYRLTVDRVAATTGVTEKVTLVVPAKNLDLIAKLAKGAGEEMKIGFTNSEFCALITAGDDSQQTALIGSLVFDGKFPDYRAIIPKSYTAKAMLSAAQLKQATRLAMLSASGKVPIVQYAFGKDALALFAMSDNGEADAQINLQMEGKPVTMKFNGAFILDMIAGMPEDAVMIELNDPTKPAAAYSFTAGKDAHLAIVMPMHPGGK